ncbi:MAG: hypothetical protein M3O46_11850, partial [Myxococcota bacterium]|nr:hypothetical protein [Myxococcota bacterium]
RRVQRAAFFVGFVLAMWTLARPASAMPAGLCDDRGATAIAPPPALQASDEAVRRARAPASCAGMELPTCATIAPAPHGPSFASADPGSALLAERLELGAPYGESLEFAMAPHRPLTGIHLRIERPPRS